MAEIWKMLDFGYRGFVAPFSIMVLRQQNGKNFHFVSKYYEVFLPIDEINNIRIHAKDRQMAFW